MTAAAIRLFDFWMTRALRALAHALDRVRALIADRYAVDPRQIESRDTAESAFDTYQLVLRLAAQCPPGPAGDDIRRAACELIEANSPAQTAAGRRRLLNAIAQVDSRRSRGRSRVDDPGAVTMERLGDAVRGEVTRPHAQLAEGGRA